MAEINKVLNERELAVELGISCWTVRGFRLKGGCPHFWCGGRVFYRLQSVSEWMNKQEQGSKEPEPIEYGIRRID